MSFDLKIINGDLVIKNGQLTTVVDSEKLIQDILKICLTEAGSNPMQPWYGSSISPGVRLQLRWSGKGISSGGLQQRGGMAQSSFQVGCLQLQ